MSEKNDIMDLDIDMSSIKDHEEYRKLWDRIGSIEIKMVEKNEECIHNLGDTFIYENPYKKPEGVCNALLHVLELYTWRVAFGFPSWNSEDRKVHRIHCPDAKGTVWEMRRINHR
jgi:uncharacterized repeat protein (TIGR04076 family)